jgi:aminotransferase
VAAVAEAVAAGDAASFSGWDVESGPMVPSQRVARRTSVFTQSVIREMTRQALIHDALNLAQGYPDFPAPDFVKQAAVDAINADINQYAITWGSYRLRKAIADKARRYYGLDLDPDSEVTVTCGATEAMMCTQLALVEEGDEIIVFEPFYENYGPDAAMSGARLVYVPLHSPDFSIDPDELRAAFSPRTRAIIVNTPSNPCGKVFTRDELESIAALCMEFDALCITDEVYEHIILGGATHVPMATLPGMAASPRPSASPAGGSATSSRRPGSASPSARCTTS